MAFKEFIELEERVSAPAKKAKTAVDQLLGSYLRLGEQNKKVTSAFKSLEGALKKLTGEHKKSGDEAKKAGEKHKESLLGSLLGFEALKKGAEVAVDVVKDLYAGFIDLERAKKLFGNKDPEGNAQLKETLELIKSVGVSQEDAISLASTFGRAFPTRDASRFAGIVLDIKETMGLSVEQTKEVAGVFESLSKRSFVGERQQRQVVEFFHQFKVADEVSKATGKSVATVVAQLKKGTLPARELALGLEQAQKDFAGTSKAGEAAQKLAAHSVEDQIGRIKSGILEIGETFAEDLFGGKGNDPAAGFKKMADAIHDFVGRADVQAFIQTLADNLKRLGGYLADNIVPAFNTLVSVLDKVKVAFDFLTSGSLGAQATLGALATIFLTFKVAGLVTSLLELAPAFTAIGTAASVAAGGIGSIATAASAAAVPVLALTTAVAAGYQAYRLYKETLGVKTVGEDGKELSGDEVASRQAGLKALKASYAQGNAVGGVVQMPAPGEVFASVAPGETIVPRGGGIDGQGGGGSTEFHIDIINHFHGGADTATPQDRDALDAMFRHSVRTALDDILSRQRMQGGAA